LYEVVYTRTTGESFLDFYRSTRLGESMSLADPNVIPHAARNVVWYLLRLLWFAAPWSVAAFAGAAIVLRGRAGGEHSRVDRRAERGLFWAVLTTAVFVAVLSPANVRAERFIFPTYFIAGAIGVTVAARNFEGMRRLVDRTASFYWLPPATWLLLFLLSIASRVVR
jgi:hypothetical protein